MTAWQQASNAMAYKMAHNLWFALRIAAAREGREFTDPEPQLGDYVRSEYESKIDAALDNIMMGKPMLDSERTP